MAKSRKNVKNKKTGSGKDELHGLSPFKKAREYAPEPQADGQRGMDDHQLKDKQDSPINTPPKGMDA